jgi:hypothetical protein
MNRYKKHHKGVGMHNESPQSNPFSDLYVVGESPKMESSVQQLAQPQKDAPKPEIGLKTHQAKDLMLPPRIGPSLWWEKDQKDLHPVTLWHRQHRMSPAYGVHQDEQRSTPGSRPVPAPTLTKSWYDED